MKLSDRLSIIANEINNNETMADIGCDHGFLPLYLLENGICPKAILCDVSRGSLDKAKNNFDTYGASLNCEFRLGDGLKVIDYGEVDNVVIAGMGGILMSEILDADLRKSLTIKKFILQPRNKPGILRRYLCEHGFAIVDEKIVEEGKFLCEIIIARPADLDFQCLHVFPEGYIHGDGEIPEDVYYEFPEYLADLREEKLVEYLGRYKHTFETIIARVRETSDDKSLKAAEIRLKRVENLLDIIR